tara:strand:- start:13800 stop:13949 length:150 start_codon:yes stop_codon:yes gene_type:complete
MKCTECKNKTKVLDTRPMADGRMMKRRRECLACGYRFTTYEEADKRRSK